MSSNQFDWDFGFDGYPGLDDITATQGISSWIPVGAENNPVGYEETFKDVFQDIESLRNVPTQLATTHGGGALLQSIFPTLAREIPEVDQSNNIAIPPLPELVQTVPDEFFAPSPLTPVQYLNQTAFTDTIIGDDTANLSANQNVVSEVDHRLPGLVASRSNIAIQGHQVVMSTSGNTDQGQFKKRRVSEAGWEDNGPRNIEATTHGPTDVAIFPNLTNRQLRFYVNAPIFFNSARQKCITAINGEYRHQHKSLLCFVMAFPASNGLGREACLEHARRIWSKQVSDKEAHLRQAHPYLTFQPYENFQNIHVMLEATMRLIICSENPPHQYGVDRDAAAYVASVQIEVLRWELEFMHGISRYLESARLRKIQASGIKERIIDNTVFDLVNMLEISLS